MTAPTPEYQREWRRKNPTKQAEYNAARYDKPEYRSLMKRVKKAYRSRKILSEVGAMFQGRRPAVFGGTNNPGEEQR